MGDLPSETPGLGEAWVRLGEQYVSRGDFESAGEVYKQAARFDPAWTGIALWLEDVTVSGLLPTAQRARNRGRARRILERDSLDVGASMVLGVQDAVELEKRVGKLGMPTHLNADDLSTWLNSESDPSSGRVLFTYRHGGEEVEVTESSRESFRPFYRATVGHLRRAAASRVLASLALRHLANVHFVFKDFESLADDAAYYRRRFDGDPFGYLLGALAADRSGRADAASMLGEMALARMDNRARAQILDPASILPPGVPSPRNRDEWWRQQDPIALTSINERLTQHIVRWTFAEMRYGDPYQGISGVDTPPGQVVLRYGFPRADVQFTGEEDSIGDPGSPDVSMGLNRYSVLQYPGFDFRFMKLARTGPWTFYSPRAGAFMSNRANSETMGADYVILARERFRDMPTLVEATWEVHPLQLVVFRRDDGYDLLTVGTVPADLINADRGAMALNHQNRIVPAGDPDVEVWEPGEPFFKEMNVTSSSGTAFAARIEAVAPANLNGPSRTLVYQSASLEVPGSTGLTGSHILVADLVEEGGPADCSVGWYRDGLCILPSADYALDLNAPLYVYFEVYGLTADRSGNTDYEVRATLTSTRHENKTRLARLFLRGEYSVGAGFRSSGSETDVGEYLLIEAQARREGEYLLTLEIEDRVAQATFETTTRVRFH